MANALAQPDNGFVSNFSRAVAVQLKGALGIPLAGVSEEDLAGGIETIVQTLFPDDVALSTVRPDYEGVLAQLMGTVERSAPWADMDMTATAQMLLRMISATTALDQFAIARALMETSHHSAWADSSILLAARSLGNRLVRNKPSRTRVLVTRNNDPGTFYEIWAYSAWGLSSSGSPATSLFNRDPVIFGEADITVPAILYEGAIETTSIVSSGVQFQRVEFGTETGRISDEDVIVKVDGENWKRTTRPIWEIGPGEKVYYEQALQTGNVEIMFGNGRNGAAPPAGVAIDILWVETKGTDGEIASLTPTIFYAGSPVGRTITIDNITASMQTALTGGEDALTPNYWRMFASARRAAGERAVSRPDHAATVIGQYPGVYDARFLGQAEVAPRRPSMMNVVHAVLLTDPAFTDSQWNDFVDWMTERDIYKTVLVRRDPTPIIMDLTATVYCDLAADLNQMGTDIAANVRLAFNPKERLLNAKPEASSSMLTLGYSWFGSDIDALLGMKGKPQQKLIQYVQRETPVNPVLCPDQTSWVKLGNLNLTLSYTRRSDYGGRLDQIGTYTVRYDAEGKLRVD